MADIQEQIGARVQAAAEPQADLMHYCGEHGDLNPAPCGIDVWVDPEDEDPDNWVRSTNRVGSVTCPACVEKLKPAAEPQPEVDVLALVQQYGDERENYVGAMEMAGAVETEHHAQRAQQLLNQIEAEVQRLRDERDDYAFRLGEAHAEIDATARQQDGPLVLRLPEVPEGAVALVDRHQRRWTPMADGRFWESESGAQRNYEALLAGSGPLTVEMAPPREPRTWPKLVAGSDATDLPENVDVDRHGRWQLGPERRWYYPLDERDAEPEGRTLDELRELGDVREVIE